MFEKGTLVIYRAEGVCVIEDVRPESFGAIGRSEDYYILSPVKDPKSTVYVPVNNPTLVGYMRALMNAEQITRMINEVKNERLDWRPDSRARNTAFREILARGDRKELIALINTVCEKLEEIKADGRKACAGDMSVLRRAEKMLYDEFAVTTDIGSTEKIIPLLKGEIALKDKRA